MPSRNKALRNPRVRNRMKFKTAQRKRKSTVQPMLHETSRYQGEGSGIRKTITGSTRLS